jgi:hypothetical protein
MLLSFWLARHSAAQARRLAARDEGVVKVREGRQVRLLSLVDVLEPLSEGDLRELAERCPDLRLQAGQEFYRPAEHDGGLLLLKEGRVRVYLITPTGKEATLELLGAARCCGPAGWSWWTPTTPYTSGPSSRPS